MIIQSAIYQDGKVYTGKRHNDIIADMVHNYFIKPPVRGIQGFEDDKGNFLNRKEAAVHALSCGQITELKYFKDELDSSDLY